MVFRGGKLKLWALVVSAIAMVSELLLLASCTKKKPVVIKGAVIRQDEDPSKQSPIADAAITASGGLSQIPVKSDAAGFFRITMGPEVRPGQAVVLKFRHADYRPLDVTQVADDQLYVARMVPIPHPVPPAPNHPEVSITNVVVRYSEKTITTTPVGTAVRTFQVVNTPNVPCNGRAPCSPDGAWKAAINFITLNAGEGNEYRSARVSCIAGPCPFTKIEHDGFSKGGQTISVSVRDWSDTTTFLVEADVVRPVISDQLRNSYPMNLGQALNFSLPATAEGTTVEANVNGDLIVFPLGPALCIPWAECEERTDTDQSRAYHCQLKPGYRLK
ncbi:MAG TPA: hypothetical protein VEI52_23620 [Terriglobales bacterium]|nr:hypothetical protein [Terriglobales bacterium]